MQKVTVRDLRKNLSQILGDLPVEVINGKTNEVLAIIQFPEPMTEKEFAVAKEKIQGNKAMQDFMAQNTMVESNEVVNKATGKQCELPICRNEAVAQGVWVEYDFESGERRANVWLCQKHLEIGEKNANG
jgi:hypothetical protein